MSDTDLTALKQRPAHLFKPGQSGNPAGRPRGSRNRLADAFIADLRDCWEEHGAAALERCALEEPAKLVRVVAGLMPRDVNLNVAHTVDPKSFVDRFRAALEMLGNELPQRRPRVINARPAND